MTQDKKWLFGPERFLGLSRNGPQVMTKVGKILDFGQLMNRLRSLGSGLPVLRHSIENRSTSVEVGTSKKQDLFVLKHKCDMKENLKCSIYHPSLSMAGYQFLVFM